MALPPKPKPDKSHKRAGPKLWGKPPSVVTRLNNNGYQTITWVHDGCASHTYASDTPSKPLLTTHVDSEWVVSGCTYPKNAAAC